MIRSEELRYQGGTIRYNISGEGVPLVLIHGYLMSSQAWGELPDILAKNNQIILIDLPGHGKSSSYPPVHTMEFMAGSVKAVLDKLGIKKACIVGHSMGGYVALAFLEIFPEHIISLVLLNTIPFADSPEKLKMRDTVIGVIHKGKKSLFLNQAIKELLPLMKTKDLFNSVLELANTQGNDSIIATTRGMKIRPDRSKLLINSTIPIRWVLGSRDIQFKLEEVTALTEKTNLPDPNILDTGHMSFLEDANAVAGILAS